MTGTYSTPGSYDETLQAGTYDITVDGADGGTGGYQGGGAAGGTAPRSAAISP